MESQRPYLDAEVVKVHYVAGISRIKETKAVSHLRTLELLSSYEPLALGDSMLEKKGYRFWSHTPQDSSLGSPVLERLPL